MNYKKIITIINTKLTIIYCITLIIMILSSYFTFFIIKPKYESKISLIIGNNNGTTNSQSYDKFVLNKNLVETYGKFSQTNAVAENVIDSLNLNITNGQLISMIDYEIDPLTQILTLTVKSTNQAEAATICNQLAKSLKKVTAIINKSDNVYIVDYASIPSAPYNIKIVLNILGSFILGIFISISYVFIHDLLDNTINFKNDLEDLLSAPLVGVIPKIK